MTNIILERKVFYQDKSDLETENSKIKTELNYVLKNYELKQIEFEKLEKENNLIEKSHDDVKRTLKFESKKSSLQEQHILELEKNNDRLQSIIEKNKLITYWNQKDKDGHASFMNAINLIRIISLKLMKKIPKTNDQIIQTENNSTNKACQVINFLEGEMNFKYQLQTKPNKKAISQIIFPPNNQIDGSESSDSNSIVEGKITKKLLDPIHEIKNDKVIIMEIPSKKRNSITISQVKGRSFSNLCDSSFLQSRSNDSNQIPEQNSNNLNTLSINKNSKKNMRKKSLFISQNDAQILKDEQLQIEKNQTLFKKVIVNLKKTIEKKTQMIYQLNKELEGTNELHKDCNVTILQKKLTSTDRSNYYKKSNLNLKIINSCTDKYYEEYMMRVESSLKKSIFLNKNNINSDSILTEQFLCTIIQNIFKTHKQRKDPSLSIEISLLNFYTEKYKTTIFVTENLIQFMLSLLKYNKLPKIKNFLSLIDPKSKEKVTKAYISTQISYIELLSAKKTKLIEGREYISVKNANQAIKQIFSDDHRDIFLKKIESTKKNIHFSRKKESRSSEYYFDLDSLVIDIQIYKKSINIKEKHWYLMLYDCSNLQFDKVMTFERFINMYNYIEGELDEDVLLEIKSLVPKGKLDFIQRKDFLGICYSLNLFSVYKVHSKIGIEENSSLINIFETTQNKVDQIFLRIEDKMNLICQIDDDQKEIWQEGIKNSELVFKDENGCNDEHMSLVYNILKVQLVEHEINHKYFELIDIDF